MKRHWYDHLLSLIHIWFADSSFTGPKITSLGAEDYTSDIMLYALWTKEIGEDSSYSVDVIQDQTYTGTAIEPAVVEMCIRDRYPSALPRERAVLL